MSNQYKKKRKEIEEKFAKEQGLPFHEVLPEAEIRQVIEDQNIEYRHRVLTPMIVIWAFLSQILDGDSSCKKTVKNIIAYFRSKKSR